MFRRTTQGISIGGVPILAGALVMFRFGSANRDSAAFEWPRELRFDRPNVERHMAFGHGFHFCIGNLLARGEPRVASAKLIGPMTDFRLTRGEDGVEPLASYVAHGIGKLYFTFSDRV